MFEKKIMFLFLSLCVCNIFASQKGTPIFSDSFNTKDTFAENWVPKNKYIKSEKGKVVFPRGGTLIMRRNTPLEFYAEMDITVDVAAGFEEKAQSGQAFCGFRIEQFSFFVLPSGKTWMIYKLNGHKKSHGKHVKIDGFSFKKTIKLTLIRKVDKGVATYSYKVNGKNAGSFVCDPPKESGNPKHFKPLEIFSYNINMTLDDFSISMIKRSAADSPNVIFNSSFEHEQDGFPLYFCRAGFNMAKATTIPYEDFLGTWTLDRAEKHSGEKSLKMVFDESMSRQTLFAWGAGTVKDLTGVFSVWLKADQEDFPVWISYGKRKEVKVGTTWKRYEVVNTKLPGAGVYSPVRISFNKKHGTLWVDDLQAEIIGAVDEKILEKDITLATPYKPSELDKQRFGKQKKAVRTPEITIKKLPGGVMPSGNLDSWKDHATKLDKFYYKLKDAQNETETYLACDNRNLYVGYRCFVDDLASVNTKLDSHDNFSVFNKDSVEFFLDPAADGKFFQFVADAGGTRLDIGKGRNVAWHGEWKADVKFNEKNKSVDYEIIIPFSTLSDATMNSRWLVNFCRNDRTVKEHVALTKTPILGFQQTEYWPYATLPADIIEKYSIGAIAGSYSDNNDGRVIALIVNNLTGKDQVLKAELFDATEKFEILGKKDVPLKKGKNTIAFLAKNKTNKVRLKLSAGNDPLSDQTLLLKKSNPVSILGRLNYYMNENEAVFKVKANLADVDKMFAVLVVDGQTIKSPAASEFKMVLPLKDISDGTHSVTVTLMKGMKKVAGTSSTLVKRPYKKGAVQINQFTRSLIHDGKPVFQFAPFFVFSKHQSKDYAVGAVDWADKYGFRYLHILVDNRAVENAISAIKHAHKKGMKIMLWTKYGQLTDEEGEVLRKKLDFPNILTQMVLDEPELGMPSEKAKAFLLKMRAKYPYHPVHMNNTVLGIPNRYADLATDILMLDDYLTNVEKRTVASVVDATDIMWEAGKEEGKPSYYFLVGGNFPLHHREVSYDEQIAQTYGNIAAGCTGLSYFYGVPMTPGNWKAYIQLNKEVLALNDILLTEEEVAQSVSSADPKKLRTLTRRHDGYIYVISCNITPKSTDHVTFTLPADLRYVDNAEVMFENRRIPIKNGKFTDSFAPHCRHVYKIKICENNK